MNTKQIAQKWFDELWNKKNSDVIDELLDDSVCGVSEGGEIKGPCEFRSAVYEPLVAAFPDVKVTIDGLVAEEDEIVIRWTASATHAGPFAHLKATGKRVKFSGMTWQRIKNGKIVAGADSYNLHGLLALLESDAESGSVRRG